MVKKRRIHHSTRARVAEPSPLRGDEVVSARDRFKGALQDLIPLTDEETDSASDDNVNKSKKHSKRKSQNDKAAEEKQQPFVMKLFDRSVDLAQFNENTPLYVICRAWMANQPHQMYSITVPPPKRPLSPEIKQEPMSPGREEEEELVRDTYFLPPPSETCHQGEVNIRIPKPVERETEFTKMYEEGDDTPSTDDLLNDNLKHWQKVRKSWHEASSANESRYSRSLTTLVAMFDKFE